MKVYGWKEWTPPTVAVEAIEVEEATILFHPSGEVSWIRTLLGEGEPYLQGRWFRTFRDAQTAAMKKMQEDIKILQAAFRKLRAGTDPQKPFVRGEKSYCESERKLRAGTGK